MLSTRPQVRRDYPLSLSISISGGKETNKDSPSNGERSGKSSNLKAGASGVRIVISRRVFRAAPWTSPLEQGIVEGENPVLAMEVPCFVIRAPRVELFGIAAQNGW